MEHSNAIGKKSCLSPPTCKQNWFVFTTFLYRNRILLAAVELVGLVAGRPVWNMAPLCRQWYYRQQYWLTSTDLVKIWQLINNKYPNTLITVRTQLSMVREDASTSKATKRMVVFFYCRERYFPSIHDSVELYTKHINNNQPFSKIFLFYLLLETILEFYSINFLPKIGASCAAYRRQYWIMGALENESGQNILIQGISAVSTDSDTNCLVFRGSFSWSEAIRYWLDTDWKAGLGGMSDPGSGAVWCVSVQTCYCLLLLPRHHYLQCRVAPRYHQPSESATQHSTHIQPLAQASHIWMLFFQQRNRICQNATSTQFLFL